MPDLDQQLDGLTDEEVLDAINRRAQRKANAAEAVAQPTRDVKRQASNDLMRAEVKRRFGKELPAAGTEDTTADTDTTESRGAASGRVEAGRRFPKGN